MTEIEEKPLSEREVELIRLMATGVTNKEIARRLHISTNTVKVHLRNIFAKLGVTSRTEAAMYAVRTGLVEAGNDGAGEAMAIPGEVIVDGTSQDTPAAGGLSGWLPHWGGRLAVVLVVLVVLAGIASLVQRQRALLINPVVTPLETPASRWRTLADMPTARHSLAVAAYENQVFAIAGETQDGVSGVVERYDPSTDAWSSMTPKPLPVSEVGAAVIGGLIYVPGGRTGSGVPTDTLEVYDPRQDRWESRAALPMPLSAYALVAFEGRLYLFGGWNGDEYVNSVYSYDPSSDAWNEDTPMPTQRGYAGAAVAGGKIYVVGGYDGKSALDVNEAYLPDRENANVDPWIIGRPLPVSRYAFGIASIADIIHLFGGITDSGKQLEPLEYLSQRDEWQSFESPMRQPLSQLSVVPMETNLFLLGGWMNDKPTSLNLSYIAIYTILIPELR
jgi:DNA-binding CsgD family transcriptional regulator